VDQIHFANAEEFCNKLGHGKIFYSAFGDCPKEVYGNVRQHELFRQAIENGGIQTVHKGFIKVDAEWTVTLKPEQVQKRWVNPFVLQYFAVQEHYAFFRKVVSC